MSRYLRRPYARLVRHRYKLLLASLLLLVLGSGFAPATADPHVFAALLLQNLVVGVLCCWGCSGTSTTCSWSASSWASAWVG